VIVGPVPQWNGSLGRTIFTCPKERSNSDTIEKFSDCGLDPNIKVVDEHLRTIAERLHVAYISAYDVFCNKRGCMRYTDENDPGLTTYDYGHLSPNASRFLVDKVNGLINMASP
jgi:hypothetical protein